MVWRFGAHRKGGTWLEMVTIRCRTVAALVLGSFLKFLWWQRKECMGMYPNGGDDAALHVERLVVEGVLMVERCGVWLNGSLGEDETCVEGAVMEGRPRTKEWWLKVVVASFCKVPWKCVERVHER